MAHISTPSVGGLSTSASADWQLRRGMGLTGSSGTGKSTVAELLARRGWTVLASDELAREVVRPGDPSLGQIREEFGPTVFHADGALNRAELARIVFAHPVRRERLEQILHPRIRALWLERARMAEADGKRVAVDVPLLYESNAAQHFRHVVVVACSPARQSERLRQRGWSDEEIEQRLAAQWPQQKKIDQADFVLWNDSGTEDLEAQLARILPSIEQDDYAS